ncbi:hypothetical protein SAMN05660297_00729 [Natronincola peptidivorans]|uniref:Uncharacterized protein n=1 Tax=Natronincola peptidivorans TaxID=426128 RepID=A0A1H9ZU98_9FIRM|nr:hypothetical protein SAMN05660297_00729 [Natronincola peptidivorans]
MERENISWILNIDGLEEDAYGSSWIYSYLLFYIEVFWRK